MKKVFSMLVVLMIGFVLVACASDLPSDTKGPFTVTFNSMGGTEVSSKEVNSNEFFLPDAIPLKDNYIFAGWFLDENYYYPMAFSAGTSSSLTLYAKWILVETTLTQAQVRDLVQLVFAERGYNLTASEMISQIEAMFPDTISLTTEEVQLIFSEMLETTPMYMTEEELNAYVANVLASINLVAEYENYIIELLAEVSQSVVMIESYNGNQIESGGSGVIYKRVGNTYYVLTNEHVVDGYAQTDFSITMFTEAGTVTINKGSNIKLLGKSVAHDLAILTFTSAANFRVITLGNHSDLKVGQLVFAIGSPLDLPNTQTMGMISAIDREMWDSYGMDTITIQHTAAINPGNSGGALINIFGELVGLNNMSYVDMEVGEGINGLHFAIQIDIIRQMIPILE